VGEAVAAAPNNSRATTEIRVKAGTYSENVEVPPYKTNIALVGEGREKTIITGSRSAGGGWTTFRTATFGNHTNILTSNHTQVHNNYLNTFCISPRDMRSTSIPR